MSGVAQRQQVLEDMLSDCVEFNDKLGQLEKWVMKLLEACDQRDMGHDVATVEQNIETAKVKNKPFKFLSFVGLTITVVCGV